MWWHRLEGCSCKSGTPRIAGKPSKLARVGKDSFPLVSGEHGLLTPSFQTSSLQNLESMKMHCFKLPSGTLSWQFQQMNTAPSGWDAPIQVLRPCSTLISCSGQCHVTWESWCDSSRLSLTAPSSSKPLLTFPAELRAASVLCHSSLCPRQHNATPSTPQPHYPHCCHPHLMCIFGLFVFLFEQEALSQCLTNNRIQKKGVK